MWADVYDSSVVLAEDGSPFDSPPAFPPSGVPFSTYVSKLWSGTGTQPYHYATPTIVPNEAVNPGPPWIVYED